MYKRQEEQPATNSERNVNLPAPIFPVTTSPSVEIDADGSHASASSASQTENVDAIAATDSGTQPSGESTQAPSASEEDLDSAKGLENKLRLYEAIIEEHQLSYLFEKDRDSGGLEKNGHGDESNDRAMEYQDIQGTLIAATDELDHLRDSLDVKSKELESAQERNSSLRSDNENLEEKNEELVKTLQEAEAKLLSQQLLGETKLAEFQELQAKHETDLAEWENQRAEFSQKLMEASERADVSEQILEEAEAKVALVETEIENSNKQREDMLLSLIHI